METPGLEGEGGQFAGISAASLLQNTQGWSVPSALTDFPGDDTCS